MAVANVANTDVFGTWLAVTNQLVVAVDQLVTGNVLGQNVILSTAAAFTQANAAILGTGAAFSRANQSFGVLNVAGQVNLTANNNAETIIFLGTGGVSYTTNANLNTLTTDTTPVFLAANTAQAQATAAYGTANAAGVTASGAQVTAVAAFAEANTAQAAVVPAFAQANTARDTANTAVAAVVPAFAEANTAQATGVAAFTQANAAYTAANNAGGGVVSTVTSASSPVTVTEGAIYITDSSNGNVIFTTDTNKVKAFTLIWKPGTTINSVNFHRITPVSGQTVMNQGVNVTVDIYRPYHAISFKNDGSNNYY